MKTPFIGIKGLVGALMTVAMLVLVAVPVAAQTDTFAAPRNIVLLQTNLIGTTAFTSTPIDVHSFVGVGMVQVYWTDTLLTNTLSCALEGSNDRTNYVSITNAANATLTSLIYTNIGLTSLTATNSTWVPGTITTATPSTAGFAGKYLVPEAFVDTAVLLTNSVGTGAAAAGLIMNSLPRYLRVKGQTTAAVDGGIVVIVSGFKQTSGW